MENTSNILSVVIPKAAVGNRDACAWLYQQYSKPMFNICMRMTANQSDAEDILQDAFIAAFNNIRQLKEPAQFGGWLRRIVVNECIRFGKKRFSTIAWQDALEETGDSGQEDWWSSISMPMLHESIKQLPDGCRQVFVLYAMEDYSHRDIASNLQISESTSKSQYHRARQLLKQRITQQLTIYG